MMWHFDLKVNCAKAGLEGLGGGRRRERTCRATGYRAKEWGVPW